ncbi:MAG: N-acetylmuramoyl-L-alanine amidase [Lachnospiraceae bacterium]|nr:N-acetylmuramoyl-L-alanine amidase [Lachnospiraceae bacterium]
MKKHGLLILTIITTLVCMPVMLFLFSQNEVFAGNMLLEDAMSDEDSEAIKMSLDSESNIQVVEGMEDGVEASLGIPLEYDTEIDRINVYEDKSASHIKITIPTEEKNFYYRNELTGSQKGIAELSYDYVDAEGNAEFDIITDGFYISTVHLTQNEIYLELNTPKELYGHVYVIDASHGGEDTGDSAYGIEEKNVTLGIAQEIDTLAKADEAGGFYFTRYQDEDVSAESRAKLISLLRPDYSISIHTNADGDTRVTNGICAIVNNPDDLNEVTRLISVIATETGQKDLGVTSQPSEDDPVSHRIYIYTGYVTNKAEALQMGSDEYISKVGGVIYAWLLHEDNLK